MSEASMWLIAFADRGKHTRKFRSNRVSSDKRDALSGTRHQECQCATAVSASASNWASELHEFVGILLLWPDSFCRTSSAIESPTTAGPLRVGPPFAPDSLLEP